MSNLTYNIHVYTCTECIYKWILNTMPSLLYLARDGKAVGLHMHPTACTYNIYALVSKICQTSVNER